MGPRSVVSRLMCFVMVPWLISTATAGYREAAIARPDGTSFRYVLRMPNATGYPVLLTIQGSACQSIHDSAAELSRYGEVQGWGQLWVEKYGIDRNTTGCPREYLKHNSITQRIQDYFLMIDRLKEAAIGWSGALYVMGISEGGWIAPIVAAGRPEAKRLVLISGSGAQTLQENYETLVRRMMRNEDKSEEEIRDAILSIRAKIAEIKSNPTSDRTWFGDTDTYFYWNSIFPIRPLKHMMQFSGPILMIHGTGDDEVAVEGAQLAMKEYERRNLKNLTYWEYDGTDHMWYDREGQNRWYEMLGRALRWLR